MSTSHITSAAIAITAALSLGLTGCGGAPKTPAASGSTSTSSSKPTAGARQATFGDGPATIATARAKIVNIYAQAGDDSPHLQLRNPTPNGVPRVFLVLDHKPGWLHVLLPVPPNDSEGWIPTRAVRTNTTNYWLQVRTSQHRLRLYRGKKVLLDAPAAIGKADTPTPGGRYYLTELLQAPDPTGPYGPYAYGLSGYSTSMTSFNGHDPIIGIHGTNEPKLIGTSVSHGCVRVTNSTITRLAKMLPLGTPVQITA